jgi:hypothetical protein
LIRSDEEELQLALRGVWQMEAGGHDEAHGVVRIATFRADALGQPGAV